MLKLLKVRKEGRKYQKCEEEKIRKYAKYATLVKHKIIGGKSYVTRLQCSQKGF